MVFPSWFNLWLDTQKVQNCPVLTASSIKIETAVEDLEDVPTSEPFRQSVAAAYRQNAQIEAEK